MATTTLPRRVTLTQAFTDASLPVGTMIPVQYGTVPADWRRDAKIAIRDTLAGYAPGRRTSTSWQEVCGPLQSQGGCRFGCKLYARQRGVVVEYAVFHSLTYGHSHSPAAR